jgi:outer membrane receptor protein involved in Fe transport
MKLLLHIIIFTLFAGGLQAAYTGPAGNLTGPAAEAYNPAANVTVPPGNILGIVLDKNTDQPVEFATIGVYSESDSSLVTGSISDDKGEFKIEKLPQGDYYLDVRFIGYSNERINKVSIRQDQPGIYLGSIELKQSSRNIKAVEIVAQQAAVEYKIDKKVVSVSQAVSAAGGSAVDVLETAPSISTDVNGDVLLRGSSSFTVLVDGKPSVLQGSDALRQMPASSIQNIEIITNPSVKYNPEGSAGILNIVTKKNRQQGINGLASTSLFSSGEYSADLNLSRRYKKLNLSGGLNLSDRPSPNEWYRYRETYSGDTVRYVIGNGDWTWGRRGERIQFGGDYFASDKTTISAFGNVGHFQFRYANPANFHDYTIPATDEKYYRQESSFATSAIYYSLNTNFLHKFDDKGHEISGYINYSSRNGNDNNEAYQRDTDADWNPVGDIPLRQRGIEDNNSSEMEAKLDYSRPLGNKSKLEAGYQGSYDFGKQHNIWEVYDPDRSEWVQDPGRESNLDYTSNVQGGYAMFANQNRILDFQAGLRTEYTDRVIRQRTLDETYRVNRFDFFPSLNLSRKFKGDHQLQASYSRRIQRPRSFQLDPYPRYNDPTSIWKGNPLLEPEYVNSWELNYMKSFGRNFFALETYYRKTLNEIARIAEYNDKEDITISTFDNLNQKFEVGTEAVINMDVVKWWNIMASANLYRERLDATNIASDVRTANSWDAKFDNSFTLKWGTRIQLSSRYYGPSIRAQGSRKAYFMANLGIRQDFFKRKLILTLTARDLFMTQLREDIVETPDQYLLTKFKSRSPIFGISLSYAINNYKQRNPDEIKMDFSEGGF